MIRITALVLFIAFLPLLTFGQIGCNCPEHYQGDTEKSFDLNNGNKIGLCGYTEDHGATYSEFAIFNCFENSIIQEWDATQNCIVALNNDTLNVQELHMLPVGNNFSYKAISIDEEKFYFIRGHLQKKTLLKNNLPFYSNTQSSEVLKKAESLGYLKTKGYYDSLITVSNMLLWAYISGNKQAEKYLSHVEQKYGPFDGAISEEWSDIWMLYLYYKESLNKRVNK